MSTYVAPSARTFRPSRAKRPPSLTAGMSAASSGGVKLCASVITATPRGHFSRKALIARCNAPRAFASVSRAFAPVSPRRGFASATYFFTSKVSTQSHPKAARAAKAARSSGPASKRVSTTSASATPFSAPSREVALARCRASSPVSRLCLAFASRAASRNNHAVSRQPSSARAATASERASDAQLSVFALGAFAAATRGPPRTVDTNCPNRVEVLFGSRSATVTAKTAHITNVLVKTFRLRRRAYKVFSGSGFASSDFASPGKGVRAACSGVVTPREGSERFARDRGVVREAGGVIAAWVISEAAS